MSSLQERKKKKKKKQHLALSAAIFLFPFGITETILVALKIEYRFSRCYWSACVCVWGGGVRGWGGEGVYSLANYIAVFEKT